MPLSISYMGSKRQLATSISEVIASCAPGPLLDVFSGICVVASAVAPLRQIWTNDLQHFAHEVSLAHFCSKTRPPERIDVIATLSRYYSAQIRKHSHIALDRIKAEEKALASDDYARLKIVYENWGNDPLLPVPVCEREKDASLFRDLFAGSYFGILQALEIDALRFSIDEGLRKRYIDEDQHRWLLIGLCVAMSKCSTSTGHFAQPLSPKQSNIKRFRMQRLKSIRSAWLDAIETFAPIGSEQWRKKNRAMCGDANHVFPLIACEEVKPTVVYADPPYTSDQYSRYYHIYETAILYDYPKGSGRGIYRPDRAVSNFSLASGVREALSSLISNCAKMNADLVLSYPIDGLLIDSRDIIPELIFNSYGCHPNIWEISHEHSTMGGSKGAQKRSVTEVIYKACRQ